MRRYRDEGTKRYRFMPLRQETAYNRHRPWKGKMPPPGKHWQYPPKTLERNGCPGRDLLTSANGNPRLSRHNSCHEAAGIPVQEGIWQ